MHLHINPHDKTPVYQQIQLQIARAIVDHEIRPGELLESHQELAVQLAVSPSAVNKAYHQLESDGLCDQSLDGHFRVATPILASGHGSATDLALTLLKREFLTQELRTAREAQHRLLPPTELHGDSWTLNSRCYPAGALAGDFYEIVQQDEALDIVVADVAGKGLAAGLIMATTKSLIPLAAGHDSPASALAELNRRLLPLLSNREFVALAWVRFEPRTGIVRLANAGLPDPYLLRYPHQVEALPVAGDRLPLGIRQQISYSTRTCSLRPSDRLLLVTDGIPETMGVDGDPIGYGTLGHLLAEHLEERSTPDAGGSLCWLDGILDRVSRRTGSIPHDDWTAVLLDYHPSEGKTACRS